MNLEDARNYYSLIKNEFPANNDNKFIKFYDYFETTCFRVEEDLETKFSFDLWSYSRSGLFSDTPQKRLQEFIWGFFVLFIPHD